MLLAGRGYDILRVKGLLDVGGAGPLVLNGVQHVVHPPVHLDAWPDDDRRSRLVFIGRGIDTAALTASLAAFNRAAGAGRSPTSSPAQTGWRSSSRRAITSCWISFEPSPISSSGASR